MTLNELLVEWSYRTKKGYPDLGNPSDILVLKEILERLELPTDVLDELEDDEPKIDDSGELDDLEPNPEQAYDYILETLNPGFGWTNYGVTKCITTSKAQKEYIKKLKKLIEHVILHHLNLLEMYYKIKGI